MMTPSQFQKMVNDYLESIKYDRKPEKLYEPVKYVLSLGGKRIRPVLMLMAYNLMKDDPESILPVAIGLETYHNYTLVLDDMMDRADVRRKKQTVHKKWNDNEAILCSIAMGVIAYQGVAEAEPEKLKEVLDVFSTTCLEIDEGQQMDMDFEERMDVKAEEYMEMIRLKTSVLLACALKIGAILGGMSKEDQENIYKLGESFGLAFQLQDDYLDVYGDERTFGKAIGGDIMCNKKTYMLINCMERAQGEDKDELSRWLNAENPDRAEKVKRVTALYNKLGIKELCQQRIGEFFSVAKSSYEALTIPVERKAVLWDYISSMMSRDY